MSHLIGLLFYVTYILVGAGVLLLIAELPRLI